MIGKNKIFTLEELNALMPLVINITSKYHTEVEQIINDLDGCNAELGLMLEEKINKLADEWKGKLERLGARTNGLWLADFDSGDGFYCWKFPEPAIAFWHPYIEGFRGRKPLNEKASISAGLSSSGIK